MRATLFALAAMAVPLAAQAEDAPGQALFLRHCATCHGLLAHGDGPMTAVLAVDVPDLTGLAARNGGKFPLQDVIAVIDGRTELRGHGGPMPVFGFSLNGGSVALDGPDGSVVQTKGDILAIAQWLESVQD